MKFEDIKVGMRVKLRVLNEEVTGEISNFLEESETFVFKGDYEHQNLLVLDLRAPERKFRYVSKRTADNIKPIEEVKVKEVKVAFKDRIKLGDRYYCVNTFSRATDLQYSDDTYDYELIKCGNFFETEEEAQQKADEIKAIFNK